MRITPRSLAETMRRAAFKRKWVVKISQPFTDNSSATDRASTFFVYDDDGGVLRVTVEQYKDAI